MNLSSILSILSPLLVIIGGWRQRFTLLWLYAATGFIIDLGTTFLRIRKYEYHWTGNIFVLAEFLFISFFYKKYISKSPTIFLIIILVGAIFFISNTILNDAFFFNMLGAGILCIIYIIYGLLGFYKLLQHPEIIYLGKSPFFIINVAFFLYSSANSLLFLFGAYLAKEDFELLVAIWGTFFISINILRYFLIGIALFKTSRN